MDDFEEYESNILPNLGIIRFYRETFFHILENHPEVRIELPSIYKAIERTIRDPMHVELSYQGTYVFVDGETTNKSGDPFRVPVKLVSRGGSGRIRTAYFATAANPTIAWRRR
jgi:hypothetical protein